LGQSAPSGRGVVCKQHDLVARFLLRLLECRGPLRRAQASLERLERAPAPRDRLAHIRVERARDDEHEPAEHARARFVRRPRVRTARSRREARRDAGPEPRLGRERALVLKRSLLRGGVERAEPEELGQPLGLRERARGEQAGCARTRERVGGREEVRRLRDGRGDEVDA
jgi:hypothetical protein